MGFVAVIIIAALTFGACFLLDKGFTKTFRGQVQHMSGLSVRLNKKYATFGVVLVVLGFAAIFAGINGQTALLFGGIIVELIGIALITYYMTFGIFYDDDGFVLTTFGKRSRTYTYGDIEGQLLYVTYGTVLIELHMKDGRAVGLQSGMVGVYPFLDAAFAVWCRQTGRNAEECDFHDPENSLWFPTMEGR